MTELASADLPRREPGVRLRRETDHCVLVDGAGVELCAMNDTAAAIWELCDGGTTVDEMVAAVCTISGVDRSRVTEDIRGVVRKLARVGAIDWSDPADAARPLPGTLSSG